jgi:hypothetical protein
MLRRREPRQFASSLQFRLPNEPALGTLVLRLCIRGWVGQCSGSHSQGVSAVRTCSIWKLTRSKCASTVVALAIRSFGTSALRDSKTDTDSSAEGLVYDTSMHQACVRRRVGVRVLRRTCTPGSRRAACGTPAGRSTAWTRACGGACPPCPRTETSRAPRTGPSCTSAACAANIYTTPRAHSSTLGSQLLYPRTTVRSPRKLNQLSHALTSDQYNILTLGSMMVRRWLLNWLFPSFIYHPSALRAR